MKLEFLFTPTADLTASLSLHRDLRPETLTVVDEPAEIPGGFLATYQDPGGATLYVMDQSTDQTAT